MPGGAVGGKDATATLLSEDTVYERTATESLLPRTDTDQPPATMPRPRRPLECAHTSSLVDRRYRIVREIASGGGGIVFEAEHIHTNARVALKTVNLLRAPRGAGDRLLREARALGLVRHPNLVGVLDAGHCPQHGPYVVLELIEGRTLESFVTSRARLAVVETVAVVCQIAGALSALAARGIVHRDVKPANVLVVPGEGRADKAVLIDLGIAALPATTRLTLSGEMIGTPEYMAPEQATSMTPSDPRTDVYGLGVLAYECLTGSTPFAGQIVEVIARLLSDSEPAPMSRFRTDVPPALEAAILRALRRQRDARWPDAASFARACVAAMGGFVPDLRLFNGEYARADTVPGQSARRKAPRVPYHAPARLLYSGGGGGDARIEDLSSGGLLLTSQETLSVGSAVLLKMALPLSGRIIVAPCVVRWVRERGASRVAGLEFVELPEEARREIELFVRPID